MFLQTTSYFSSLDLLLNLCDGQISDVPMFFFPKESC